jgi:hypothetical protein
VCQTGDVSHTEGRWSQRIEQSGLRPNAEGLHALTNTGAIELRGVVAKIGAAILLSPDARVSRPWRRNLSVGHPCCRAGSKDHETSRIPNRHDPALIAPLQWST